MKDSDHRMFPHSPEKSGKSCTGKRRTVFFRRSFAFGGISAQPGERKISGVLMPTGRSRKNRMYSILPQCGENRKEL